MIAEGDFLGTALLCFSAGLLAFASPCVLPILPGFLGYVAGRPDLERGGRPGGAPVLGAVLFVLGFTAVFVFGAWALGRGLVTVALPSRGVEVVAGLVVILMAAVFAGLGTRLQASWRPGWLPPRGLIGAPLLGSVFALGWSPCVGPTLSAAMAMISPISASGPDQVWAGAGLMTMYSLGLGFPFVLVATGWSKSVTAVDFLRRHRRSINLGGAVLLLAIGLMLVLGLWDDVTLWLRLNVALPTPSL